MTVAELERRQPLVREQVAEHRAEKQRAWLEEQARDPEAVELRERRYPNSPSMYSDFKPTEQPYWEKEIDPRSPQEILVERQQELAQARLDAINDPQPAEGRAYPNSPELYPDDAPAEGADEGLTWMTGRKS